ncbi:hypothetical protein Bhyg_06277, partial [Pseudolycoriella hygida]
MATTLGTTTLPRQQIYGNTIKHSTEGSTSLLNFSPGERRTGINSVITVMEVDDAYRGVRRAV